MLFISFFAHFTSSIFFNLTIFNLKSAMPSTFTSKSPILIIPNMKSGYSAVHFSKIFISKSYSHLLYATNPKLKSISFSNFQISNFLSTPVLINFKKFTGKMEREYINYEIDQNRAEFVDGYFNQTTTEKVTAQGYCCGGAISVEADIDVFCNNVLFLECSAYIEGGAIQIYYSLSLIINNCIFERCQTTYDDPKYASLGAAIGAHNINVLSISDTKFKDNDFKVKDNSNYSSCLAIFNCQTTTINKNTEFENNKTVRCDILFSFNIDDKNPHKFYEKTVVINRCCFKTLFDNLGAIQIDNGEAPQPNILKFFNVTGCSFLQPDLSFDGLTNIPEGEFKLKPNNFGIPYCAFSDRFTPSDLFTLTSYFSSSLDFSSSTDFTTSAMFSNSQAFTTSDIFSPSQEHPETDPFTQSDDFSSSGDFSESGDFTESGPFTQSNIQSTECFSSSDRFTFSDGFSLSSAFTQSSGFAAMAKGVKLSSGGIAGIVIACLVLLAIIILLLVLFLRRKKSAFIPPEDDPMNIDGLDIPINMYD